MDYPQRKHTRVEWNDYSAGLYFVTICVEEKRHAFGEIHDGVIKYTPQGQLACQHVQEIDSHWEGVKVVNSVVMPNHVHLIIGLDRVDEQVEPEPEPESEEANSSKVGGFHSKLAAVVGGFKSGVTRCARRQGKAFSWQAGFHDHIIRNRESFESIMAYVSQNVYRWDKDCFNEK